MCVCVCVCVCARVHVCVHENTLGALDCAVWSLGVGYNEFCLKISRFSFVRCLDI